MSPEPTSTVPDPKTHGPAQRWHFGVAEGLLVLIFLVSAIGVAVTDISPTWGHKFWLALVPLLALSSIHRRAQRPRKIGESWLRLFGSELFHWAGLLAVLQLAFMLYNTNRINAPELGIFSLLSVALATFLAGVHFDWHFAVLGALLGLSALLVAWVEASIWFVMPIALIAVLVLLWIQRRRSRSAPA
ncbi:MAG: hypothetical protein P8M78_05540 [Myxococcota bacterium]|nr:hypothetical protein [Myxococcota bacterium]